MINSFGAKEKLEKLNTLEHYCIIDMNLVCE